MATNWSYPEGSDLEEIAKITLDELQLNRNSPILAAFPSVSHEWDDIRWYQEDNATGLMNWRGLGGKPRAVQALGYQEYRATPGVYGDFMQVEEEELTRRSLLGSRGTRKVDVSDLVGRRLKQLLVRELNLREKICTDLLIGGVYSINNPDNASATIHTDSYTPQTFTASVPWSTVATATPLADLTQIALVPFGKSVDMAGSTLWVNQVQMNYLLANRNANDIWGLRMAGGATMNGINDINAIFALRGLPTVKVYDGIYLADNATRLGSATRYIATGKGIVIGRRTDGAPIGEFAETYSLVNNSSAPYRKVKDKRFEDIPGTIEVHAGFTGGPIIKYPSAVVVCNL